MESGPPPTLEDLAQRYYSPDDPSLKGAGYLRAYTRLLEPRRQEPLAILELGVSTGASLLSWHDYLPNATIIGIDIEPPPARVVGVDRVHVLQGDQADPALLDQAAAIVGRPFDLIIDDASHFGHLTKRSLHYLFPRLLAPGGWYVIEDFGTGFLPHYADGTVYVPPDWTDAQPHTREYRSSQFGMVGIVKQLIDAMMQEVATGARSYLAIERLLIEPNIVFIEKSRQPGAPWPGPMPDKPRLPEPPDDLRVRLDEHAARLAELERVVSRLRRVLAPVLWLRRSLRK
ncbi:MAG: class I SAM-dependent methyltransferase [Acetobacteraceae bacterium]